MKINNRVFKKLTNEPFLVQEINGKEVEFHYMNDTPFLQQFVSRGRFYVWTSDGKNYKLLIERGYYDKVSYFFEKEINEVWLNFLTDVSSVNSRMSKRYLMVSLGISLLIVLGFSFFWKEQLTIGIIVALVITLIGNMIHSNKVNKVVREKNMRAQQDIRELLTEENFNKFIQDQDEYMRDYFKFDEEESDEVEVIEELSDDEYIEEFVEEDTEEVREVLEEDEVEVISDDEVTVTTETFDYESMTVAELKNLARDRGLTGYSALRKKELIELLKENI